MVDRSLARLRISLRRTDRQIEEAVERRLGIARRIGETKRSRGLPVRDYAVERQVVGRWRDSMEAIGVPPERGEVLARWLVEEAVRVEEQVGEASEGRPRTADILVIGGAGAMGRWLAEFFRAGGHRVGVFDPRATEGDFTPLRVEHDLPKAARSADVIVVATPMRVAPAIYRDLWKTRTRATIFDILSIKAPLFRAIRSGRRAGFHITSVHPLFGPATRTLSGRNLLVLDCGDEAANRAAEELFRPSSVSLHRLPIEAHDALMADVLALPHAVSLLFSLALIRAGHTPGDLARAAPTSFARQAEVARLVTGENPELSYDIQALNPASEALFDRLGDALRTLRGIVHRGDQVEYDRMVRAAHALLETEDPAAGTIPTRSRLLRRGRR